MRFAFYYRRDCGLRGLNLTRHPDVRDAVFIVNVSHGDKTKMGIEVAKMRLGTKIDSAVGPALLAAIERPLH